MSFRLTAVIAALVLAPSVLPAHAQQTDQTWTGTGELGLAMARGNSRSESFNTKFAFSREDAQWQHAFGAAMLYARAEVSADFDGDGVAEKRLDTSANRYDIHASSAYKFNAKSHLSAAVRYENDDFAPYDYQATLAVSYGYRFIDNDTTKLVSEIGPGFRRSRETHSGATENDVIARGWLDFQHQLTTNTRLVNTLLVESGADNSFIQNDLGLAVAMNERFALKFGLQTRHNTDVQNVGLRKTDTLTTANVVYNFR